MSTAFLSALGSEDMPLYVVCTLLYRKRCANFGGLHEAKRRRDDIREFPLPLCLLRLLLIEYPPLLLRCFDSTGNKTSNPLKSLSTREPQAPLRQVCHKQSSAPNAC